MFKHQVRVALLLFISFGGIVFSAACRPVNQYHEPPPPEVTVAWL